MADNLPFTNLDFASVKENLKSYLQGQDQFKDYNFEGSNINVLLDILAYNTFQNNFYTNMAISEMFLDSAQLRESVMSHAKELNYLPRSRRSARSEVAIEFFPTDAPATITIPARTEFTARCGTAIYKFWTDQAYVVRPTNTRYTISDVVLYEGKYINEFYDVTGEETQRFIISNDTVDTTSIRVYVSNNSSSSTETEYTYRPNLYDVESDDTVFYLQPYAGNRYEVTFGKSVYGNQPINGNVVRIEYRTTVGEEANGISTISLTSAISNYSATVALTQRSQGGAERESIESIRYFAPKALQVQERAVTESDYAVLLRNNFPEIRSVAVYGGEELLPPQYGRVVIAAYVNDDENISQNVRDKYVDFLSSRTAIAVEPIIVPAKFMYVDVSTNVYYNVNKTAQTEANINQTVTNTISQFSVTNLEEFKKNLRFSKLSTAIDNADTSIISNDTTLRAIISITPVTGVSSFYTLQFGNALSPDVTYTDTQVTNYVPCISSDSFTYNGQVCYMIDNGAGRLDIVRLVNGVVSYVQKNVGAVDYTTGDVTIRSIVIEDYDGDYINMYAKLLGKDILAPKDRIVKIRPDDISITVYARRQ